MNANIVRQGKVVVEPDGNAFLVMTPDGSIQFARNKKSAEKIARAWFQANLNGSKVGIGEIEWR